MVRAPLIAALAALLAVRAPLIAALAALLATTACGSSGTSGGGSGGDGGSGGGSGGSAGSGGGGTVGAPEYGICDSLGGDGCLEGLSCISFGTVSRCVRTCTLPDQGCEADERCVPQPAAPWAGYCAERREHFELCSGQTVLVACVRDSICLSKEMSMPARCVPICDVGDLGDFEAVAACPSLPAELGGGATTCTPTTVGTSNASLCSVQAGQGGVCDDATLRCDPDGTRPDTDDVKEPGAAGEVDPGALRCLPTFGDARCLRVCTADDGATESPCACPAGEASCVDPVDTGLTWGCRGWSDVPSALGACVLFEDCSVDTTVCADNTVSGYVSCLPSPYDDGPAYVCSPPP